MTEKLLQFIWQFQHFNRQQLLTEQGDELRIIYPGSFNSNQGPDFQQAKIVLDDTVWVGHIELHLKTSDWYKHAHHQDDNYRNVTLHVVWENDLEVTELHLPTLELQSRVSNLLLDKYSKMMESSLFVSCENSIGQVQSLVWAAWQERLLVERLYRKSTYIVQLLNQTKHSWEDTLWWMLARNFGLKVNEEAFEAIARSLPVNILAKHRQQLHQVEALLFGQAGLLHAGFKEDYPLMLWREYRFLAAKYRLRPIKLPILFSRMRPFNFPSIRLAQLAVLICHSEHLFSKLKEAATVKDIRYLLDITANDYWHYHYCFDEQSIYKPKTLGAAMIDTILINTVIPILFAYSVYYKNYQLFDKVLNWMEDIPAEKNTIIKSWRKTGIPVKYARESQALLELKTQYCDKKRCLDCAIGNAILKRVVPAS